VPSTQLSSANPTHFTTRVMAQIAPVDFKLAVVVHVHKLMNKGVFHMLFAEESAGAEGNDTRIGTKPSRACVVTGSTDNVGWRDMTS
jgi:hypothetical protein